MCLSDNSNMRGLEHMHGKIYIMEKSFVWIKKKISVPGQTDLSISFFYEILKYPCMTPFVQQPAKSITKRHSGFLSSKPSSHCSLGWTIYSSTFDCILSWSLLFRTIG